jgi:hypothetical protein
MYKGYKAPPPGVKKPTTVLKPAPLTGVPDKKAAAGPGNSPPVHKPSTKMSPNDIDDRLGKNNGQKYGMQGLSVPP